MIDPSTEKLLSLRLATDVIFLNRNGRKPHISTLYRWTSPGIRGVQLETIRVGGTRCTTEEALIRFLHRLSDPDANPVLRTPGQRRRAIARAERELAEAGI